MRQKSEVWAAASTKLEALLTQPNEVIGQPRSHALEGVAVLLHLAALCTWHCPAGPSDRWDLQDVSYELLSVLMNDLYAFIKH